LKESLTLANLALLIELETPIVNVAKGRRQFPTKMGWPRDLAISPARDLEQKDAMRHTQIAFVSNNDGNFTLATGLTPRPTR